MNKGLKITIIVIVIAGLIYLGYWAYNKYVKKADGSTQRVSSGAPTTATVKTAQATSSDVSSSFVMPQTTSRVAGINTFGDTGSVSIAPPTDNSAVGNPKYGFYDSKGEWNWYR